MKLHRTLLFLLLSIIASTTQGSTMLYWADASDSTIKRSDLNGSNTTTLVATDAETIAIDSTHGTIYWAHPATNKIQRANLADGSNVEDIYFGGRNIRELGIDASGGHLYWVEQGGEKIRRANLDGSDVVDVVTGIDEPYGIDLDVPGGKIYWTSGTTPGGIDRIQRANLNGSVVEDLLLTGGVAVHGIAIDLLNDKMYVPVDYWTAPFANIQRANLDGTGGQTLLSSIGSSAADWRSIALDVPGGKVYFQEQHTGGGILRMNLDGTDVERIISTGMPRGIALADPNSVPEPTSLALWSGLGAMGLIAARRRKRTA